jgi:predicted ATPase
MQLASFSVKKYRSIVEAEKLALRDMTILIGPNNEGKSNILRALVVGMRLLSQGPRLSRGAYGSAYRTQDSYLWERDFPVSLQSSLPDGESIFQFEFILDDVETLDFFRETGSHLNGTLPIRLTIGQRGAKFQVVKRGPGARALTQKRDEIVAFLSSRIHLEYVPAVRTASEATRVVTELLDRELSQLERDVDYANAVAEIERLQRPVLNALAETISTTLRDFLPNVQDVRIEIPSDVRRTSLRRDCRVIVDDGTATDLQQKGDGVQSLAALSLIRHVAQQSASGREQVLAIEEPEAHLHPEAIHELRAVLRDVAERQQVVVSTHCPVLVNRLDIGSNIIVRENKAAPAKNVREIRNALGVRTYDNLSTADVVLIVEGESDRVVLRALLNALSSPLSRALSNGMLAIDTLRGGSNLSYKLTAIRDSLCVPHAYLDNDDAGRDAAAQARSQGLLAATDETFVVCAGMRDSELEDMFALDAYRRVVHDRYAVDLAERRFRTSKKWSARVGDVFRAAGKRWDETVEKELKMLVADTVATDPNSALNMPKATSLAAVVAELEGKVAAAAS